jgi:hypothetical protein
MQQRGKATMGQVAKAVAGAEAIEIKATIPEHQVRSALARFGLNTRNDEERHIYFFDTLGLELLDGGIIARARRVIGDEHDSTVKFRPVDPAKIGAQWRKYRDFKIEVDASEKAMVKSASFSMPVQKGLIKRVAAGQKPIEAVFTAEQEEFLTTVARRKVEFTELAVLGPLLAQRWRFEDPSCPWPITAELWRREDGEQLMEVSIKAPIVQAAVAIGGFMAYLAEVGAERGDAEQTKTRWALRYYAAKLKSAPALGTAGATRAGKPKTMSAERRGPAIKTPAKKPSAAQPAASTTTTRKAAPAPAGRRTAAQSPARPARRAAHARPR